MRRSIVALAAVFALVVTGCNLDEGQPDGALMSPSGGEGIFAAGAVEPFDSCADFLGYVKRHAMELVGPYGLEGYGQRWYGDVMMIEMAAARDGGDDFATAPTTTMAAAGREGVDYSGTNVQVAGVDEPDLVKTDGERIFVVARGRLHWIDATGVPAVVASMPLDGWGQQLFLSGDRLLVMTSGSEAATPLVDPRIGDVEPWYSPRTVLTEIDVSDPAGMRRVRTLTMDGSIISSRMTDGVVRVVVRSGPIGFSWVYPEGSGIRAEREATEANKRLIEESTIENWVPWYVLEDHERGMTSDAALLGCDDVGHPEEFSGLSMLNVLSIDLTAGLEPGNGIGLMAEGSTVYASPTNLYVATAPWMAWRPADREQSEGRDTFTTEIHAFDISDARTARYRASGEVEGVLHSQWSMDEWEGTLRVVVTDENPWWGSSDVPETSVVTLRQLDDRLVQVGSVGGLGKDERVYAVRFIADRGYVVTFRQVDPLYVIDLSDPRDPSVEGELKINGYSAYLHPIGEDLLLGVGQDATDQGRVLGTQVSVFDVSDPADPRRVARLTFDEAHSDAEWDTHAFLWWPRDEISVLPMQRWSWEEASGKEDYFSGAVVVSATRDRVRQIAEITHPSYSEPDCPECGRWSDPIVRSLVIGDTLFTISEAGVLASDMASYEPIEWLDF